MPKKTSEQRVAPPRNKDKVVDPVTVRYPKRPPAVSLLDIIDENSALRKSTFWGWGKLIIILAVWWSTVTLFTRVHENKELLDLSLYESLAEPVFHVFGLWGTCLVWACVAYLLGGYVILKNNMRSLSHVLQWMAQCAVLSAGFVLPCKMDMGVISSGYCGILVTIHTMKMHSYIEYTRKNSQNMTKEERMKAFENLSFSNFLDYLVCPILVYEPSYPRQPVKLKRGFIRIGLMAIVMFMTYVYVSEVYIPTVAASYRMTFLEAVMKLVVPSFICGLLVFFIFFECICNILADFTGFAHRRFYDDWWNSTTFDEFNRKWNRVVYEFLLRHVYLHLQEVYGASKLISIMATLLISALLHEILLAIIFKRIDMRFFAIMMCQIPIFKLQASMAGASWGNYLFWYFIIFGLGLSVTSYGRVWADMHEEGNQIVGWI